MRENLEAHYLSVMSALVWVQRIEVTSMRDVREVAYQRSPEQRVCSITIEAGSAHAGAVGVRFTDRVTYTITRAADGRFDLLIAIAPLPTEGI